VPLIVSESVSRTDKLLKSGRISPNVLTMSECLLLKEGRVAVHRLLASAFDFREAALEIVPVANDSCGGLAAVVNYRNWPNCLAVPSGVSLGAVEINRVGRQRKNDGEGRTTCKYDTILDSWLTALCCWV